MDSGVSMHIGNKPSYFPETVGTKTTVVLPYGKKLSASGQKTIFLSSKGKSFKLRKARFMPQFNKSLFSISRATDIGTTGFIDKHSVKAIRN